MNNRSQSRIASVLTMAVGAWLLLTPLVISMSGAALVSMMITGGVFVVVGLVQLFWMNTLPSWVSGIAALWLFVSAFVFSTSTAAAWNEAISAIVAFVLAVWDGFEVGEVEHEHHLHA